MQHISQRLAILLLRPYISSELPGWGKLYAAFVGDYRFDCRWKGYERCWVRGKFHDYEMSLDLGYWSNRQTFFLRRFYDLPTQLAMMAILRNGDTFIDIGANEGMISLLAPKLVGSRGKVIAFEPNAVPRVIFESALVRNHITNIQIVAAGLAEEGSVLPLRVPKINTGEGSFGGSAYETDETETVDCTVLRGDDALSGCEPSLIKIDVEGFEVRVLRGLTQTIMQSKPQIIVEIVARHLKRAGTSVAELNALMHDLGYFSRRLALSDRKKLKLVHEIPGDTAYADYLWTHKGASC